MPIPFMRRSTPKMKNKARLAPARRVSEEGFTLFEILAVLSIASLLLLSVAGRFDFGIDARSELEAERVRTIARLAHARSEAITAGESRGLTFSDTTVRYDGELVPVTGERQEVRMNGVRASWASVRFDAYGWRDSGSSATVTLTHIASNRSVTLTIGEGGYVE